VQPEGDHQRRGGAVPLQEITLLFLRLPFARRSIHVHHLAVQDPADPPGEIARVDLLKLPPPGSLPWCAPLVRRTKDRLCIVEEGEVGPACPARTAEITERVVDGRIDLRGVYEACRHRRDGTLQAAALAGGLLRSLLRGGVKAREDEPGVSRPGITSGAGRYPDVKERPVSPPGDNRPGPPTGREGLADPVRSLPPGGPEDIYGFSDHVLPAIAPDGEQRSAGGDDAPFPVDYAGSGERCLDHLLQDCSGNIPGSGGDEGLASSRVLIAHLSPSRFAGRKTLHRMRIHIPIIPDGPAWPQSPRPGVGCTLPLSGSPVRSG